MEDVACSAEFTMNHLLYLLLLVSLSFIVSFRSPLSCPAHNFTVLVQSHHPRIVVCAEFAILMRL